MDVTPDEMEDKSVTKKLLPLAVYPVHRVNRSMSNLRQKVPKVYFRSRFVEELLTRVIIQYFKEKNI